jgi:hypothetical protein
MIKDTINTDMDQKMDEIIPTPQQQQARKPEETGGISIRGHIKIHDPESGEVFHDKANAIHYENFSEALAYCIADKTGNFIKTMRFGNGGTSVDPTGVINYLPTKTNTQNSTLYTETFSKIVDDTSVDNLDPTNNKMEIRHIPGQVYTDVLVTCLIDYGEPAGQAAFDNSQNLTESFVFDELGLFSTAGKMLTHVVFHPVQKSLNRRIQIDYTVRIQSLTNLSAIG